jgi:hypothetical protein
MQKMNKLLNPGITDKQCDKHYDYWIVWQITWQIMVLATGEGELKTMKNDGKLWKEPMPT